MDAKTISEKFELSVQAVTARKSQLKVSYQEYHDILVDKFETLEECQNLCVELGGRHIKDCFRSGASANSFLINLYQSRDNLPNSTLINNCKKVIKYVKSKEFEDRKLSLEYLGELYNKKNKYFYVLRRINLEKFNYIFSFDENQIKSIDAYIDHIKRSRDILLSNRKNKQIRSLINSFYKYNNEDKAIYVFFAKIVASDDPFRFRIETIKQIDKCIDLLNKEGINEFI